MAFLNRRDQGTSVSAHLVYGETPSGATDGTNASFVTASTIVSSAIDVFLNGAYQSLTIDYTLSGSNTVVFNDPPQPGDIIRVDYIK